MGVQKDQTINTGSREPAVLSLPAAGWLSGCSRLHNLYVNYFGAVSLVFNLLLHS